jgi:hypothetical protein
MNLRGRVFVGHGNGMQTQRCYCEPRQPRWNCYDYNQAVEVCRCCAASTVRSGSRWSPFFCNGCKPTILARNRAAGFALVPIGRHSIMNQVSLPAAEAADDGAVDAFVARFSSLGDRMERLEHWRLARHRALLADLRPRGATIRLPRYLAAARARALDVDALVVS